MSNYYKLVGTITIFTINTYSEYKEFRNEWRENYKELTSRIRKLREDRKNTDPAKRSKAQYEKQKLRVLARNEMQLLTEAKEHLKTIKTPEMETAND